MIFLYNIFINTIHKFILPFTKLFFGEYNLKKKINEWDKAQKKSYSILRKIKKKNTKSIWFHCASLGEYEQIKPIISYCQKHTKNHIYITFFSTSGFNNLNIQDLNTTSLMCPVDTKSALKYFIKKINPEKVFISKNEVWPNMINMLYKKSIPIYFISSKFKKSRLNNFIYGNYYTNLLKKSSIIFVQDLKTKNILLNKKIKSIVIGDLRVNQVIDNLKKNRKYDFIKKFKNNKKLIIVGSSHYEDYKIILNEINRNNHKWIIVPHENKLNEINYIKSKIKTKCETWSKLKNIENTDVLIIDEIGLLKELYFYADIVYIGGGFTKEIHNSLEAAVFNKPLIFGPKYDNFQEADYFIKHKIAFAINNKDDFEEILEKSLDLNYIKNVTQVFFKKNTVNIKKIIDHIF